MKILPGVWMQFFCSYDKLNKANYWKHIKLVFSVYPLLMYCIWEQLSFLLVLVLTALLNCCIFWIVIFAGLLKSVGFVSFDFSSIRIRKFKWFHAISVAVSVNGMPFICSFFPHLEYLTDCIFTWPCQSCNRHTPLISQDWSVSAVECLVKSQELWRETALILNSDSASHRLCDLGQAS